MRENEAGITAPAIVRFPPVFDAGNARYACEPLYAAIRIEAPVVIADLTATASCDAAGLYGLIMVRDWAAVRGVPFRLVLPPGALLRRWLELLRVDHLLPVYPSVEEAARLTPASAQDPLPPAPSPG